MDGHPMHPGNLRRAALRQSKKQSGFVIVLVLVAFWCVCCLPFSFGHIAALAPELCHSELYLVAFTLFLTETVLWSVIWWHLSKVELQGHDSLISWLRRLNRGLICGLYVSTASSFYYIYSYFATWTLFVGSDELEVRLLGHYIVWTVSMPVQWMVFLEFFSSANSLQITRLLLTTAAIPVCGGWSALTASMGLMWVSYFAFTVGTLCMLLAFSHAIALPLEPALENAARPIRAWMLCVWTVYPLAEMACRSGLISPWTEQVLIYTCCDICSKTVTLSAMFFNQVLRNIFLSVRKAELQEGREKPSANGENFVLTMSVHSWRMVNARNQGCPDLAASTTTALQELLSIQQPLETQGLIGFALEELIPDPTQVRFLKNKCVSGRSLCLGSKKPVTIVSSRDPSSHSSFKCSIGCHSRENQKLEVDLLVGLSAEPQPGPDENV